MMKKVLPGLLVVLLIGLGALIYIRTEEPDACQAWAETSVRKAWISYTHMLGLTSDDFDLEEYTQGMFERSSFRIDGTLYRNPGGCTQDLLAEALNDGAETRR